MVSLMVLSISLAILGFNPRMIVLMRKEFSSPTRYGL
jgi:hypothetical protein